MTIFHENDYGLKHEIGTETFYFPLLYYNGHGLRDHFYIFQDTLAVGKVGL